MSRRELERLLKDAEAVGKLDVGFVDVMRISVLVLLSGVATAKGGSVLVQQPVRPLPKLGVCPMGC